MSKQKGASHTKPASPTSVKTSTGGDSKTVKGSVPKMVNPPPTPTKKK